MDSREVSSADYGKRALPIVGFIVLAVAYIAIIKVVGAMCSDKADIVDGRVLTEDNVTYGFLIPLGVALVFVYLIITVLGWWRTVLYDPRPVRRWVWFIPIVFVVAIAAGINYQGLADRGGTFTIMLIGASLLVGFGEEGMFRAIGVTSLRRHGLTEAKVALWSSVIFGLVHISNIIGGDARALGQAVIVSFAGYFFYLIRRVSRSNILNSFLHAGFDFMIISGTAIIAEGEDAYPGSGLAILVYVVCGIVVFVKRHTIEPAMPGSPSPLPAFE